MDRDLGPWNDHAKLARVTDDIEGYFRVYYRELRNRVEAHDRENGPVLPHWLRGGRLIQVSACADGVVVVHNYHNQNDHQDTSRTDYEFDYYLPYWQLAKDIAAKTIPPRPGGDIDTSPAALGLPDYPTGQPFGAWAYLSPVQIGHALPGGSELVEDINWSRLDIADLDNLDAWRDQSKAPGEAQQAIQHALERE